MQGKTILLGMLALALGLVSLTTNVTAQDEKKEEVKAHVEGDKASDFELEGIGKKIKLSDNFGEKGNPVVVVFSRANW